jgi:autotransporter-associated beta strand protein
MTEGERATPGARPRICLAMIVRNEAHIIHEAIAAVAPSIDCWSIVDTGSTDGTQDRIRRLMAERGIPGDLHERPWRDFGHNRSEAMALAQGRADYIWVMDADDVVEGTVDFSGLTADGYAMRFNDGLTYWRSQLFRDGVPWRYRGVLHEVAVCDVPHTEARLEGAYHIHSRRLGARNLDPHKYARDAEILQAEVDRNPDDARSVFYLAQSYRDAGDFAQARTWYARRAAMGGWDEEVSHALYQAASAMDRLGEPWPAVQDAYLRAWNSRPQRAEPLHAIACHYRKAREYPLGHLFARMAAEIPLPAADKLFVHADVYAWRAVDEQAVCASWLGRWAETFDLCHTANTFQGFYYQVGGVTEVTKLANQGQASSLGAPSNATENRVSFGFNGSGGGTLRFIGSAASTSDRVFVLAGGTAASSNVIEASGASAAATLTLTGSLSAGRAGSYAATLGGTNAGVNEYAGVIGNGSGTVSLVKAGSTTWALTGTNTYSGSTTISGGRLSVNGAIGNAPVTVLATAELGGSGSIAGPVSVASGGTLSPGNSIASLAAGATSFAMGATFEYEVDSSDVNALGTAADLLVVSGNLDLDAGNGTILTFTDLAASPTPFVDNTTIFALVNYSGVWNGGLFTYGGTVLADGSQFQVGSQFWEIDYNRTSVAGLDNFTSDYVSGSFVTVTAVPEPATLLLAGLGIALAAARHRRRVFDWRLAVQRNMQEGRCRESLRD